MTHPENLSSLIPKPEKDHACQNLIKTPDVSRHGFLRKMADSWSGRLFESFIKKKWSSKFIVLRSGCVYIYANEVALCCDKAYSLFGFQEVHQYSNEAYKGGKWLFQVVDALGDDQHDRSLLLSANSEDDMKLWIDAFQKELFKANRMIFSSSSTTLPAKITSKPSLDQPPRFMPRFSDKDKEKMKLSMRTVASVVNISREAKDDSLSEGSDLDEPTETAYKQKSRPLPKIPIEPPGASQSKAMPAEKVKKPPHDSGSLPQPLPKPAKKPPTELKPSLQVRPVSSVKPLMTVPENDKPKVKVTAMPSVSLNLRERKVPDPPPFPKTPKSSKAAGNMLLGEEDSGAGYEEHAFRQVEYELCDAGDECVSDPVIRDSFWKQDADKALQLMMSIAEDGVFLIRDATDGFDYKTLMVRTSEVDANVRKYKIVKETSNTYALHLGQSGFKSLRELIQYYQKNSLPNRAVKLTKPYKEVCGKN